ncbi:MAG: UDP-glucose/GDP-mannose dehydrogenase family protein, partial [Planctomycetota bacterium]
MRVTMIGTGYVGLVTGACFADAGNDVVCLDIDSEKIARLRRGDVPIFEPGLDELIRRNTHAGRLRFTDSYDEALSEARCAFIAVGTPQAADGSADLSGIFAVADALAPRLGSRCQVVIKSTVPVGTNRTVQKRLSDATGRTVYVASNPEFLREGAAIADFTRPDRVVIGADVDEALQPLREL